MIDRKRYLNIYVATVALCGAVGLAATSFLYPQPFSPSDFASLLLASFAVELGRRQVKHGAQGSLSFVVTLAAPMVLGGFWGALIAAASILLTQVLHKSTPMRMLFNVSQVTLAVSLGTSAYALLGGHIVPTFLGVSAERISAIDVGRDFALFYLFSSIYFVTNSLLVSVAIALSSEKRIADVWHGISRGVLGYDLVSSLSALMLAWLYVASRASFGWGAFGLLGVVPMMLAIRHVYSLYRTSQQSSEELLALMVKAIEARDPYTSGHSLRVKEYSSAIAQAAGLSSSTVELIETAALLHDVGKIHEEFAPLLRKDGALTQDEFALMKTHSVKSATLVANISRFKGFVYSAVRHHHERWDGLGYPDGLSADQIPVGARVIALADTIDAMTSDRPYRPRMTSEDVFAELRRCSGRQFDPDMVEQILHSAAIARMLSSPERAPVVSGVRASSFSIWSKRAAPTPKDRSA